MLDLNHTLTDSGLSDVQVFTGRSQTVGGTWEVWVKPRGKSMCSILLLGKGGNGGISTPAAATSIAGGGGGGSGTQVSAILPLAMLPDRLYLSLAGVSATTTMASYISISPEITANTCVLMANGGGNGGNATSATAGSAGSAGSLTNMTAANMPLGWSATNLALAGQAGSAGGGTQAAGANVTLPTTGLIVTGGTGGGGVDSIAGTPGYAGGALTVPAGGVFQAQPGGAAGTAATVPPEAGSNGYAPFGKYIYFYGGTGSGSSYNVATGAGLVQKSGGNGAYGCGGGGVGAAQTGSVAAPGGLGGPALALIVCW